MREKTKVLIWFLIGLAVAAVIGYIAVRLLVPDKEEEPNGSEPGFAEVRR